MSAFVLSKIFPSMNIDASQRFIFGLEGSPEPLGSFKLDNIYVPVLGSPSLTNFEIRNNGLSGYRWIHETQEGDTYGSFKLQKFLSGSPTGTDLITFNQDGTFVFPGTTDAKYIIQTANPNLPNAQVLGSLVGGILKNTNITGVLSIAVPAIDYFAPDLDSNLNLNSHKVINLLDPTSAQDAATKAYVDAAVDNSFGPSVALPFIELGFNWNNASGSDPFVFNNYLVNTSSSLKQYIHRISAISGSMRKWDVFYDLGDPTTPHGILQFQFSHPSGSPVDFVPFKIEVIGPSWNPFIYINGTLSLNGVLDMGGHRIGNVVAPVFDQDATNKLYVSNTINTSINASTLTLTGSVTGSGNINGSLATSFANSQTVSGTTQTFNYSNALTSAIFSLANTNSSAVTCFRANAGASSDYVELAYDASNGKSYINLGGASNDRLEFRANGTGIGALLYTGLFGLGTITPTTAKLVINGGVQNIGSEESALRVISALNSVKIELQCTNGSGKLYEIRSTNTGALDVINRTNSTSCLAISSTGDVTIPGTYYGRRASSSLSMTGNATATAVAANTWTKVAGTTALSPGSNQFSQTANNRLAYTGTPVLGAVVISVSCSFSHNVVLGTTVNFSIYKNGVQITTGMGSVQSATGNVNNVNVLAFTTLSTNDYIEVFCRAGAAANITVSDMVTTVIAA